MTLLFANKSLSWKQLSLLLLSLLIAYTLGWVTANTDFAKKAATLLQQAYQMQYEARVGKPGSPRAYYVYHHNLAALKDLVEHDPEIIEVRETRNNSLAIISIREGARDAIQRIESMNSVDSVLYLPFLCH